MSEQKDTEIDSKISDRADNLDNIENSCPTMDSQKPFSFNQTERANPEQQIDSRQLYPGQVNPEQPYPEQQNSEQPYPGQAGAPWQNQQPLPGQQNQQQPYPGQAGASWQNQQPLPGQQNQQQPYPGQAGVPWQNQQPLPGQQNQQQPYPGQAGVPWQNQQPLPGQQNQQQPYPGQPGVPWQNQQPCPGQQNSEQHHAPWQNQQPYPGQTAPPQQGQSGMPWQNPNMPNPNFQSQQGMNRPPAHPMAVTSLVFGIISLLVSCCCFPVGFIVGFVLAMTGLVLAISSKKGKPFSGYAIAGLILSILGICESLFLFFSYLITARMMQDPNFSSLMNQIMEQYERSMTPQMISSILRKLLSLK